jgi:hypothetical protein
MLSTFEQDRHLSTQNPKSASIKPYPGKAEEGQIRSSPSTSRKSPPQGKKVRSDIQSEAKDPENQSPANAPKSFSQNPSSPNHGRVDHSSEPV